MEVLFQIQYYTKWGEEVCVILPSGQIHPLSTTDGRLWRDVLIVENDTTLLQYRYIIRQGDRCIRKEWDGIKRCIALNGGYSRIVLNDSWRERPKDSYLYSSAFSGKDKAEYHVSTAKYPLRSILFKVRCPRLRGSELVLALSGNQACLGNWDTKKPVIMHRCGPNEWCASLDADTIEFPVEYKFLAWDTERKEGTEWIVGDNRRINPIPIRNGDLFVFQDDIVHFDLPLWKAAGVAVPVFSLRSESSWGIGDFGDLKKFVDWASLTGQKVIQILPINDTIITHTWTDSYPYNSISVFAFHPMYIDISRLNHLMDKAKMQAYENRRKELNALLQIDYEETSKLKMEYLKELFGEEGEKVLASYEFHDFYDTNKDWLLPYAVFSYLRDVNGTPVFSSWPKYGKYDKKAIFEFYQKDGNCNITAKFYCYLQFILHTQLLEASNYARSKNILLKGDIPIGISPNSVEAWTEPHYFNMNGQAGAPPDPFSSKGQNWGFPTYNWEVMAKDNYKWWKHRLHKMSEYFDAYRIDHILGFFRIWEIPSHSVEGLLGQFAPSLAMSPSEIERYGLHFRKEAFTKPYITQRILNELFGKLADAVKRTFLCQVTHLEYSLLPPFNTQRKVEAYFADRKDEEAIIIKEGLYKLINNVLFVPDHKESNLYHPRIAVRETPVYKSLTESEQRAMDALYEEYYYRRQDEHWRKEALKKLPEIVDSTRMLVCGEDLGMIPGCVKGVMDDLRILSLEIQRMPKKYGETFADPSEYPYLSVCSISTHDMSTLRGWWHEDLNLTQQYYEKVLKGWGDCPKEAPGWICDTIVLNHLLGNSMLCILALQDWLSIDENVRFPDPDAERINIPAVSRHYWRYRMHITIEALMKSDFLNKRIYNMIQKSGRAE